MEKMTEQNLSLIHIWIIPGYEYIVVENHNGSFEDTIKQMNEEGMSLVGAVHDLSLIHI